VSATKLLNRKHVRQFALMIAQNRFHRFTRVGDEFFVKCEANLKTFIRQHVEHLPSKGKTIT